MLSQKDWKQGLGIESVFVAAHGRDKKYTWPSVHQQMSGDTKCGLSMSWGIFQPQKAVPTCHCTAQHVGSHFPPGEWGMIEPSPEAVEARATGLPRKSRGMKFWFMLYTMNELENKLGRRTNIITWFRLNDDIIRTGRLEGSWGRRKAELIAVSYRGSFSLGWWKFCHQIVVIVVQCCHYN